MNRFVWIVFFSLSVVSIGMSQPIKRYGAKIGFCSATWDWKTDGSTVRGIDNRLGLDLGAFVEWFNTQTFSALTEVHFVQKGMKQNIPITTYQYPDGTGEFIKHDIRLDYLSFVVLPKVRFEIEIFEFYMVAGMRIDLSLSNNVSVEGRESFRTYSAKGYQSLIDNFKSPQLGGTVGFGAQINSFLPLPVGIEFPI